MIKRAGLSATNSSILETENGGLRREKFELWRENVALMEEKSRMELQVIGFGREKVVFVRRTMEGCGTMDGDEREGVEGNDSG